MSKQNQPVDTLTPGTETATAAPQGREAALEVAIAEATPLELIHMLMRGAIEKLEAARQQLTADNPDEMERLLIKTTKIIAYLRHSLDKDTGQEFAHELDEIYCFVQQQLEKAHYDQRDVVIAMAQNAMEQVAAVWKNGMLQWEAISGNGGPIPHTLLCHLKSVAVVH